MAQETYFHQQNFAFVHPAHLPPLQAWVPLANEKKKCRGEFLCTCEETGCVHSTDWCECRAVLPAATRSKIMKICKSVKQDLTREGDKHLQTHAYCLSI